MTDKIDKIVTELPPYKLLIRAFALLVIIANNSCANQNYLYEENNTTGITELLDIAYDYPAGGNEATAKLDVFYIPDGRPKRLMVFVHGGSWIGGDKSNLRTQAHDMIDWFIEKNYVVAAVNFRLSSQLGVSPVVSYREQATDIAYALSWLSQNANNYGAKKDEIVLIGFSSGAHLVPLLTTDNSYFQSAEFDRNHIIATISLDVHVYDVPLALSLMQGSVIEQNIPFIEHLFGSTQVEQQAASPLFYANNYVPPSLIISAELSDSVGSHGYITAQTGENYVDHLQSLGNQATWMHYDNETHSSLVTDFGSDGDQPTQAVAIFLESLILNSIFANGFE